MTPRTRLPGVYFEVDPPRVAEALPRMDIAALVGFAASGPLDIPVPIEDIRRFRDIFGADVPLAWDDETQQVERTCLGPAVESFFRNGGRRCWVVRVAGAGETNRFPIPALLRMNRGVSETHWRGVAMNARSQGAWSDLLTVGTALNLESLNVGTLRAETILDSSAIGKVTLDLPAGSGAVGVGDLLRLGVSGFDGGVYLIVEGVTPITQAGALPTLRVQASSNRCLWFNLTKPAGLPATPGLAVLITPDGEQALPAPSVYGVNADGDTFANLPLSLEAAPMPGNLVRLRFAGRDQILLVARRELRQTAPPMVQIVGEDVIWPLASVTTADVPPGAATPAGVTARVERLTFDLLTWQGDASNARMRGLAFNAPHGRFWGALPSDAALFELPIPGRLPRTPSALEPEAAEPRFPLAAAQVPPSEVLSAFFIPLGMGLTPDRGAAQGTLNAAPANSRLERDGLQAFSIDLFFDPRLRFDGIGALLANAEALHYLQGLPLMGMHALLPLDEVTLLAAPDGIHRGWWRAFEAGIGAIRFLPAPNLSAEIVIDTDADPGDLIVLRWTEVGDPDQLPHIEYILQEGADPDFRRATVQYQGKDLVTRLKIDDDCPETRYFRVRAVLHGDLGLWSATELVHVPPPDFLRCGVALLTAPFLHPLPGGAPDTDSYTLNWDAVPDATGYVVEAAGDTSFVTRYELYRGPAPSFTVRRRGDGAFYYRVRAVKAGAGEDGGDLLGPWSNAQGIVIPPTYWVMRSPADFDTSVLRERFEELHQIMLKFCTARADLFTVLALPAHYRDTQAIAHANRLRTGFMGEMRALTYGAVAHPWVAFRFEDEASNQGDERVVFCPPDAALIGQMAGTALDRGAWIASANQPLRGAVALRPAFSREVWLDLFEAQVNLLRPDPRGVVVMSADTLNPELIWTPITVRRLLILLRRLALREGATYVFQPNNEFFRALVRSQFETLLLGLFQRGAFAGRAPASSFQVFVGAEVNTPQSVDLGRLIIELRVAPSRPMAFITVRLVQAGTDRLVIEER
jgi:hypothetical protein